MAVFGPKDKDAPLLTQIYQLDIPAPDPSPFKSLFYHTDLDQWIGPLSRDAEGKPLEYWSDSFWPEAPPEDGSRWSLYPDLPTLDSPEAMRLDAEQRFYLEAEWGSHKRDRIFNINTRIESQLHQLLPVIALTKRIMTSVCDDNRLSETDAEEFLEQSKLWRPSPSYEWEKDDDGYIQLSSLRVIDFSPSVNGMEWQVLGALERGLNKAQSTPRYFQRCRQCSSVFLVERKDQLYCSRRCNNRAQTRRWRAREKSAVCSFKA